MELESQTLGEFVLFEAEVSRDGETGRIQDFNTSDGSGGFHDQGGQRWKFILLINIVN